MQGQRHFVRTDGFQRAFRQMNLGFCQRLTGLGHGLGYVHRTHRTEQLAFFAGPAHHGHRGVGNGLGAGLGFRQLGLGGGFQFLAALLELGLVLGIGGGRYALGDQVVTRITGPHLDQIAQVAQVLHLFQ